MGASINVNGVCRHIKTWNKVVKEMTMGFENIPFGLTYSVPTLPIIDSSKIEWTMNECVQMSEINIFSKREKFFLISVGVR